MTRVSSSQYRIPKEHGAYVVLIASWVVGMLYTPHADLTGFALVLATSLSLFLLQDPFKQFARPKRTANPFANASVLTLGLIGASSGIALLARTPRVAICVIPLAVIGAVYFTMLRSRRGAIARSFVGFAGLTLVSPMTMIAAGNSDPLDQAIVVWIFSTLFFCTSIYCVAIRLKEAHAVRNAIVYHIVATGVIGCLVALNVISAGAFISMFIPTVRLVLILGYRKRYTSLAIKFIGIQETVVALCALAVIALFR